MYMPAIFVVYAEPRPSTVHGSGCGEPRLDPSPAAADTRAPPRARAGPSLVLLGAVTSDCSITCCDPPYNRGSPAGYGCACKSSPAGC